MKREAIRIKYLGLVLTQRKSDGRSKIRTYNPKV